MLKKSHPGDGQHGKGGKGLPVGEPPRGVVRFVRDTLHGLRLLRRW
jgi:hypothetical protein